MRFTSFNIEGYDYLSEIDRIDLVETVGTSGQNRSYELTIHRADGAERPWLGGYSVRPEFVMRFELGGQQAAGRWRRTVYNGESATFASVGDIAFSDVVDA